MFITNHITEIMLVMLFYLNSFCKHWFEHVLGVAELVLGYLFDFSRVSVVVDTFPRKRIIKLLRFEN